MISKTPQYGSPTEKNRGVRKTPKITKIAKSAKSERFEKEETRTKTLESPLFDVSRELAIGLTFINYQTIFIIYVLFL